MWHAALLRNATAGCAAMATLLAAGHRNPVLAESAAERAVLMSSLAASSSAASQPSLPATSKDSNQQLQQPQTAGSTPDHHQKPQKQQQQQQHKAVQESPWPKRLQEGTHFAILTGSGAPARLSSVASAMAQADVVLLGEYHDDPVAHALQLHLLRRVSKLLCYPAAAAPAAISSPPAGGQHQPQQPQQQQPQQQQQQQQQQPQQQQPKPPPPQQREPQQQRPLVLSLEMFERDVQQVLCEYLSGSIRLSDLVKDGRAWPNFTKDYLPLVEHAKQLQLPVIAANAPRRYVSLVGRSSKAALQQLPAAALAWLPPLPYAPASAVYASKVEESMRGAAKEMQQLQQQRSKDLAAGQLSNKAGQGAGHMQAESLAPQVQQQQQQQPEQLDKQPSSAESSVAAGGGGESGSCPYIGFSASTNFLDAQALWDASMAHAIAEALLSQPSSSSAAASATAAAAAGGEGMGPPAQQQQQQQQLPLVVHVCGNFHCQHGLGIPEHLRQYMQQQPCNVLVVSMVPADLAAGVTAEDLRAAGLEGAADFVVLTDGNLPRSFASEHPV